MTGERVSAQRGAPGALRAALSSSAHATDSGPPPSGTSPSSSAAAAASSASATRAACSRWSSGSASAPAAAAVGQLGEALGEQAGAREERVVRGQVAQAGGEPDGGRVLVRLAAAGPPSSCAARAAAAASAAIAFAERAAERGRLLGRALAGVRGRHEHARLVRREPARRGAQALRQRPLPVPAAQVAEQLVQRRRVDAVAEGLGGLVVQQVRLVDHHVLERRGACRGPESSRAWLTQTRWAASARARARRQWQPRRAGQ